MENSTRKTLFPNVWDVLAMPLIFFAVHIVFGLALNLSGLQQPSVSTAPQESIDNMQYMIEQVELGNYNAIVYSLLMTLALVALAVYVRCRGGRGAIKIRHAGRGFNPNVILGGLIWLLSAQFVLDPLSIWFPASDGSNIGRGLGALLSVMVAAPILEEILFRGVVYEALRKRWSILISILFSSLFFGVVHGSVSSAVVAAVAGVIFCALYERTSSIYTTIIVHSINNLLAFSMICYGFDNVSFYEVVGGGSTYYIAYAVAFVVFVLLSVEAYFALFRRKDKRVDKAEVENETTAIVEKIDTDELSEK